MSWKLGINVILNCGNTMTPYREPHSQVPVILWGKPPHMAAQISSRKRSLWRPWATAASWENSNLPTIAPKLFFLLLVFFYKSKYGLAEKSDCCSGLFSSVLQALLSQRTREKRPRRKVQAKRKRKKEACMKTNSVLCALRRHWQIEVTFIRLRSTITSRLV